jgi:hypothetical protein
VLPNNEVGKPEPRVGSKQIPIVKPQL